MHPRISLSTCQSYNIWEDDDMKTKTEVMERLRQSIAKKKAWLEKSDEELSHIYAERHGTSVAIG